VWFHWPEFVELSPEAVYGTTRSSIAWGWDGEPASLSGTQFDLLTF